MKVYLFSDNNDTLAGYRLAGVMGCIIKSKEAASAKLDEIFADSEIGVLLVAPAVNEIAGSVIEEKMKDRNLPVVLPVEYK